ncbi:MAG: hypothetical protein R3Y44_00045 [Rikenellaceae bacterium]
MNEKARYLNGIWLTIICLIMCGTLVSCGVTRNAQLPHMSYHEVHRSYPRLTKYQIDSLIAIYGNNKIFVDEFLEPTLIALSHYPELIDTKIEFKYKRGSTTMAARPKPTSMLCRRRYIVVINNKEEFDGIYLHDTPFNAQIGIIGHELAHIADYQNHNLIGVVGILMRYSSGSRKPLFEKEIDRATIERGLGWQLHDWAKYSLSNESGSTKEYKEFKRKHYLSPEEITQHMELFGKYKFTL